MPLLALGRTFVSSLIQNNWLFMRTFSMKCALCALLFVCLFTRASASKSTENDSVYYMVFSARPPRLIPFSIGGHAFVTWGIKGGSDSIRSIHTYGFFPGEHSKLYTSITKKKKGRIVRGFFKNSNRQKIREMIVAVDHNTWKKSLDASADWDKKGYNLMDSNCLSFLDDMAGRSGLKTPDTQIAGAFPRTPFKYIKRLKMHNKGKNQKNLLVYDQEDRVCTQEFAIAED